MSPALIAELATLVSDPERIEDVDLARVPDLLAAVEALRVRLWGKMMAPPRRIMAPERSDVERATGDRLLTVDEAAARLGLTAKALYRRAARLPFTRKLGARTLRFSEKELERWLASRR